MRQIGFLVFLLCFVFGQVNSQSTPMEDSCDDQGSYHADKFFFKLQERKAFYSPELVANFEKGPLRKLIAPYGIVSIEQTFKRLPEMSAYYELKVNKEIDHEAFIRELEALTVIEFAERVPKHKFFILPNDVHPEQYNTAITNCEQAWDLTLGSNNVVIGMIDDAVLLDHEDLAANIWTNPGEIAGNGIDDDGNGYVDDIEGWDAADGDNNPNPPNDADEFYFSHGTHCAGIAAGVTDNGIGAASVSHNVQLMAIKIGQNASSQLSNAYLGVEYAIANEVDVMSMSWGGGGFSQTEEDLFTLANSLGIVNVAAAGNDNSDIPTYPASYEGVINVGATNNSDEKADFSNHGATIDVMAPGEQIYSCVATSQSAYTTYDGTSMACPFVAGLVALMRSLDPNSTPARIEECLKTTAVNIDGNSPDYAGQIGAGRVDAFLAVQCTPEEPTALFAPSIDPPCSGQTFILEDLSFGTDITSWQWDIPGGVPSASTDENPTVSFAANGTYNVTLTVSNALGSSTNTQTVVVAPPNAVISGNNVILEGYIIPLTFEFSGSPPWSVTYTDGTSSFEQNNISDNPFIVDISPNITSTYTITSFENADCSGTFEGSAEIVVIEVDVNDDCENALPFPDLSIGVQSCVNGTTVGAFAELPFINQVDCIGGPQPIPAPDVWYTFEAVANFLDIDIQFGSNDIMVALYENQCGQLLGRECEIGSGGSLSTTFAPVAAGNIYHLQISGGSEFDEGDFTLCLDNYGESIDDLCITGQNIVAIPNPILGTYQPNQEVEFCLKVLGYNDNAADWFHAIVPELGPAWDASTLTPTDIPNNCDGSNGYWDWFDLVNGESATTVGPVGPGFFYELDGLPQANPADNWGDSPSSSSCIWTFCFKVTTLDCPPGVNNDDLAIILRNYSDSETGDWNSASICPDDPEIKIKSILKCCPVPEMVKSQPTCNGASSSSITAIPNGGTPPFTFEWSTGFTETASVSSMIDGLVEGFYTVLISDFDGCETEASATITSSDGAVEIMTDPTEVCRGNQIMLTVPAADPGGIYQWGPTDLLSDPSSANPMAIPEENTDFVALITYPDGCTAFSIVKVDVLDSPPVDAGPDQAVCPDSFTQLNATGASTYSWSPTTGLSNSNIANPFAAPSSPTTYFVTGTDNTGCSFTDSVKVFIAPVPFFPGDDIDTTICIGTSADILLSEEYPISNFEYQWNPTTGLDTPNLPNATATVSESIDYTLTITNQSGCTFQKTFHIEFNVNSTDLDLGDDQLVCDSSTYLIEPAIFDEYLWSDGSTEPTLLVSQSGIYSLTALVDGCEVYDEIEISIENLQVTIVGSATFIEGQSTTLAASDEFEFYNWSTGDTEKIIQVFEPGLVELIVSNGNMCEAYDSLTVVMLNRNNLLIPTGFTPNFDGVNDYFRAEPTDPIDDFEMQVYNRWGELVFYSEDINEYWDGTYDGLPAEMGVYATVTTATFEGVEKVFVGNVTLIR